jgi:hypothetical protein
VLAALGHEVGVGVVVVVRRDGVEDQVKRFARLIGFRV